MVVPAVRPSRPDWRSLPVATRALAASGRTRCSGRVVAGRSAQPSLACIDSPRLPFTAWGRTPRPSTCCWVRWVPQAPHRDMGQGMTQIPSVTDGLLQATTAGGGAGLAVGSPAWFAWLADDAARSFSFRSPAGAYTARKERRQRGGAYWVAYRTASGRQHKVYLGRAEDLTPDRLTEAATTLARRVAAAELVGGTPAARDAPPGRAGQGAAGLPLLATKLFVPRPRPDLVPRPRLLARLDAGPGAGRCTLLSAPAGAGKTSLLAAWLAQLDRPAAWLTLDERDQDTGQVLRYLVAALQTIAPACGRGAMAWLASVPATSSPSCAPPTWASASRRRPRSWAVAWGCAWPRRRWRRWSSAPRAGRPGSSWPGWRCATGPTRQRS